MSAGCFSWCRLHMPWGTKKQSLETKLPEKRESKPAIVPARTITKNFIERKVEPDEQLPEISRSVTVVPTKTNNAVACVKEVFTLAQSAAPVIPAPILKEAIEVTLRIRRLSNITLKLEQLVKEGQVSVADFMMMFVNHVTSKNEETKKTVMKTVKDIEEDVEELLRIFGTINENVEKVGAYILRLIAPYKQPKMNVIECMNRFSYATQLANDLHYSALVDEININLFQFLTRFNHFNQRLVNFQIYIMRTLLKTLKPRVFHGRDD